MFKNGKGAGSIKLVASLRDDKALKSIFLILTIFLLTGCGLECIEKKTGLHRASSTLEDSKEKGVFQFELQPNKLTFQLDSGRTFEVNSAWVEYSWTYQCVDNQAFVIKDSFKQVVIESKTRPKTITHFEYAIIEKEKGVFLSSTSLDFSYKGQDTVKLQLVKFKDVLDSNKTYFDKIILTKKASQQQRLSVSRKEHRFMQTLRF